MCVLRSRLKEKEKPQTHVTEQSAQMRSVSAMMNCAIIQSAEPCESLLKVTGQKTTSESFYCNVKKNDSDNRDLWGMKCKLKNRMGAGFCLEEKERYSPRPTVTFGTEGKTI